MVDFSKWTYPDDIRIRPGEAILLADEILGLELGHFVGEVARTQSLRHG